MGLRFRKSIKIAPGIRLNIGKKSMGISFGNKYGGISYNTRTGTHARVSAPGTGLSYNTKLEGKNMAKKKKNTTRRTRRNPFVNYVIIPLLAIGFIGSLFKDDDSSAKSAKTTSIVTENEANTGTTDSFNSDETSTPTEEETNKGYSKYLTQEQLDAISAQVASSEDSSPNYEYEDEEDEHIIYEAVVSPYEDESEIYGQTDESSYDSYESNNTYDTYTADSYDTKSDSYESVTDKKERLVWVDDTAKRYHIKNGCGMDNAYQVTVEEAIALGKTPCGRCYR